MNIYKTNVAPFGVTLWTFESIYLSTAKVKDFNGIELPVLSITINIWPKVRGIGNVTIKEAAAVCVEKKRYSTLEEALKVAQKRIKQAEKL